MKNSLLTAVDLDQRIEQLQQLQQEQIADIKQSTTALLSSLTPAHIIRSTLKDVSSSGDLKTAAIDTAMGIGAGFLGRKLYVNKSHNIFRRVAGTAVQFLVTNFVRNKMSKMRGNGRDEEDD